VHLSEINVGKTFIYIVVSFFSSGQHSLITQAGWPDEFVKNKKCSPTYVCQIDNLTFLPIKISPNACDTPVICHTKKRLSNMRIFAQSGHPVPRLEKIKPGRPPNDEWEKNVMFSSDLTAIFFPMNICFLKSFLGQRAKKQVQGCQILHEIYQLGYILKGLGLNGGHLVHFTAIRYTLLMAIRYILLSFGTYFSTLVCLTKKNLATLSRYVCRKCSAAAAT
jgi:hypothetical protein